MNTYSVVTSWRCYLVGGVVTLLVVLLCWWWCYLVGGLIGFGQELTDEVSVASAVRLGGGYGRRRHCCHRRRRGVRMSLSLRTATLPLLVL